MPERRDEPLAQRARTRAQSGAMDRARNRQTPRFHHPQHRARRGVLYLAHLTTDNLTRLFARSNQGCPEDPRDTNGTFSPTRGFAWKQREVSMGEYRSDPHALKGSSLEWSDAVSAASARLDEGWAHRDPDTHATASMEGELAAFLCAFGALGAEVDRMRTIKLASTDTPAAYLPSGKRRRAG
jgi:hypothetical protein